MIEMKLVGGGTSAKLEWKEAEPPEDYSEALAYWNEILKPGTIVMSKYNHVCLVGDINVLLGVCDDCTRFDRDDIVAYCTDLVDIMTSAKDLLYRGCFNISIFMEVQ